MRYGHQAYSEIRRMSVRDVSKYALGVLELITEENKRGQMER